MCAKLFRNHPLLSILGEHYIDVRLYNQSVHDSPYACNVGDPELVTVRNMPTVIRTSDFGRDETFESALID